MTAPLAERRYRYNIVVCIVAGFHGVWGFILPFSPAPLHTTPMAHFPIQIPIVAGITYLIVSFLAILPHLELSRYFMPSRCRMDDHYAGMVLTLPQMVLMVLSFFTAVVAICLGKYPDNYVPDSKGDPHLFILVDQLPYMSMAIGHVWALLDWYWWSRQPA